MTYMLLKIICTMQTQRRRGWGIRVWLMRRGSKMMGQILVFFCGDGVGDTNEDGEELVGGESEPCLSCRRDLFREWILFYAHV